MAGELKQYLRRKNVEYVRGAPFNPMTHGKIERYRRSLKNVAKLQNYFTPSELETEVRRFVNYYNNCRYHESLDNMTPADVCFGRAEEVITRREKIKQRTLRQRNGLNLKTRSG